MTTFEEFKNAVKQADARRDYDELRRLEALNPSMYDEARGLLAVEDLDAFYEDQADYDELYPARPIEL